MLENSGASPFRGSTACGPRPPAVGRVRGVGSRTGRCGAGRSVTTTYPAFVVVDSVEELTALVGRPGQIDMFDRRVALTAEWRPELVSWVSAHPMDVLEVTDDWASMLDVVAWTDRTGTSSRTGPVQRTASSRSASASVPCVKLPQTPRPTFELGTFDVDI